MIDLKDQDNLFLAACSTNRSHVAIIPVSLQVSAAENSFFKVQCLHLVAMGRKEMRYVLPLYR